MTRTREKQEPARRAVRTLAEARSESRAPQAAQAATSESSSSEVARYRPDEVLAAAVESHRICAGCGHAMIDRGCKLRCVRCGFFLDCSDG